MEYKVIKIKGDEEGIEKELNSLSKDNWEVICCNNYFLILRKRNLFPQFFPDGTYIG
jgi:hypothetical protein